MAVAHVRRRHFWSFQSQDICLEGSSGTAPGANGPPHLYHILSYIRAQVLLLQEHQWAVYLFHYPRTHPMMLEVDTVARHHAYQISRSSQAIASEQFYPRALWNAMKLDSAEWVRMRRNDPNEPGFPP